MSVPTMETDLGKILDQINQNLKETNQKLDALQQKEKMLPSRARNLFIASC